MKTCKNTIELRPEFDSRDSFYGKALVSEFTDGSKILTSYDTDILCITNAGKLMRVVDYDCISNTTGRHCREFVKQFANIQWEDLLGQTFKEKVMGLPLYEDSD